MGVYGDLYDFQRSLNKAITNSTTIMETHVMDHLVGKTMFAVESDQDKITMYCDDGRIYTMMHHQDCCETVVLDDVCGDLKDLVGPPLIVAEFNTNKDEDPDYDSATWTFYRFATIKGHVTARWHGSSNGYYSESVDLVVDQERTQEWRDKRLEVLGIR